MFLSDAISQQNLGSMFLSHNALVISETALLALIASDQVADMEESESILIRDRVEVLLQEIAFKCFDLQESLHKADMQKHINDAVRFCKIILDLVGISPEEMQLPAKAPTPILALPAQAETIGQMLQILEQQEDKTEKLRREIQILRELLFSLLSEREHLTAVVVRDIEARYMQELGRLEADLYRTECEVRLLKRKVEIMQASLNRQEPIQEETIDETVQAQYQEFLNSYEELLRKIFEAAAYFERRQKQKSPSTEQQSETEPQQMASEQASASIDSEASPEEPEAKAPETEEHELKRLYRMIVKGMHPDLHPIQTPETKTLFNRAVEAYKDGDLITLREIAAMLEDETQEMAEDVDGALIRERERLLALIRKVRGEIRAIKSRYPYTKKELLEDPERLAAEKTLLRAKLVNANQAAEAYRRRIAQMVERHE